jgi:hypothetical protein
VGGFIRDAIVERRLDLNSDNICFLCCESNNEPWIKRA